LSACVYIEAASGELVFGKLMVPIAHPIAIQGGLIVRGTEETFVEAEDDSTLSKTEQAVTGEFEGKTLAETTELAGSVSLSRANLAAGIGVALKLPVLAHLKNASLGENCAIGSRSMPIMLELTTGATSPPAPNKSIKGSPGEEVKEQGGIVVAYKQASLVENAFMVPQASGCGGLQEPVINPRVNAHYGLPSAAGINSVIFNGQAKFAKVPAVREERMALRHERGAGRAHGAALHG
jgi:hypothetical protein